MWDVSCYLCCGGLGVFTWVPPPFQPILLLVLVCPSPPLLSFLLRPLVGSSNRVKWSDWNLKSLEVERLSTKEGASWIGWNTNSLQF